jgi:hypothetical protein
MRSALNWLLGISLVFSLLSSLNNRVSYKYEVDIAETLARVHKSPPAVLRDIQTRGSELDYELHTSKIISATLLAIFLISICQPLFCRIFKDSKPYEVVK